MTITDKQIKFSFLREYNLIMEDFDQILSFIDPDDENLPTFSHRTFELLLRTCTALETVFKRILTDRNYNSPSGRELNIRDYATLNNDLRLSEYDVSFGSWRSGAKIIKPFEAWTTNEPLPWYQAYNHAKHDRDQNFKEANFKNLIDAIAGLFVLLYSLYQVHVFGRYQETEMYLDDDDGFEYANDSIFSIKSPQHTN